MKTHIFAFTLSVVLCLTARAGLKWDQTSIELHPAAADKQAIGHFKYQNTGDKPVRFKSVRTSCGCTAAQTQKEEVPAGEKGEITATFNTSKYMTSDAAVLRSKAAYAINILRSHQEILDRLVEQGAEGVARGIRNEERNK